MQMKDVGLLHLVISMGTPTVSCEGLAKYQVLPSWEGPSPSWEGARNEARTKAFQQQSQGVLALNYSAGGALARNTWGFFWNISDSGVSQRKAPHQVWISQILCGLEWIHEARYCRQFEMEGTLVLILPNWMTSTDEETVTHRSRESCPKSFLAVRDSQGRTYTHLFNTSLVNFTTSCNLSKLNLQNWLNLRSPSCLLYRNERIWTGVR